MTADLRELQRIPTSGARAVEVFSVDGLDLLAIPQLALDVPDAPAGLNVGDSDTDLVLLRRAGERYEFHAAIPAPGGEDAEFFSIGARHFLAVASIRRGSGPYQYTVPSVIHEWRDGSFVAFQSVTSFAAKQWRHWSIGDRHFLGLAQGLDLPHLPDPHRDSVIYEWVDGAFTPFQTIPSRWAYNWHAWKIGDRQLLAHADHVGPSVLYAWDGQSFVPGQELIGRAGRAFAHFERDGRHYLLVAGLEDPPRLMEWEDGEFHDVQTLPGLAARELCVVEHGPRLLVIRVNFIEGTPAAPQPSLRSQIYEWVRGELVEIGSFPTSGGTDVAVVQVHGAIDFVVSNSLSSSVRFATDTVLYRLDLGEAPSVREGAA
jgi:hypothetical protein